MDNLISGKSDDVEPLIRSKSEKGEMCMSNALFAVFVSVMAFMLILLTASSLWFISKWYK